jgi:hypothetical protein
MARMMETTMMVAVPRKETRMKITKGLALLVRMGTMLIRKAQRLKRAVHKMRTMKMAGRMTKIVLRTRRNRLRKRRRTSSLR